MEKGMKFFERFRFWNFLLIAHRLVGRVVLSNPFFQMVNVLSIALGVGVVAAIHLSNRSAVESFRATVRLVSGEADLEVRGRLPEEFLGMIVGTEGVAEASPVVEFVVLAPQTRSGWIRVLGIDPFASGKLRPFELVAPDGSSPNLELWLSDSRAIAVFPTFAQEVSEEVFTGKQGVLVEAAQGKRELQIQFRIESREDWSAQTGTNVVVMDIAWAQELGEMVGYLTSVQILIEPGRSAEEVAERLRAILPRDVMVQPPARRSKQTEVMISAFQTNLSALSMVSLLVGCYLIYNTVSASVIRRRTELGILRAIGMSPRLLQTIFLVEAAIAGFLGGGLGAVFALPVGRLLTELSSQTITSLYAPVTAHSDFLTPWEIGICFLLGVGAAVLAAWVPSLEAMRVDPREVLHPGFLAVRAEPRAGWQFAVGVGLLALVAFCSVVGMETRNGWLGFVAAFFLIAGVSLVIPLSLAKIFGRVSRRMVEWVAPIGLGVRNLVRSLHRNSVTAAALAAALAMLVSIAVMIHSFRGSVERWLERTLLADFYVAPAVNEVAGQQNFLSEELLRSISESPEVERVTTFREVAIEFRGERASLAIVGGPARGNLEFLDGEEPKNWMTNSGMVIVSESFAERFGVRRGERIGLNFPGGEREMEVGGVYRDYTRDAGSVMISKDTYIQNGGEGLVQSVGIFLRPGADLGAFREFLEGVGGRGEPLSIYSNRELRERVGTIFDDTFAVTEVLRFVAIVVAVAGVLLSFGILVRERAWEIALLRSLGATRGQIAAAVLSEAAALGVSASFFGVLGGAGLAVVLTYVINKSYFGWTVDLAYPVGFLAMIPVWVTGVAVLAAVVPAMQAMRIKPAEALRSE